MENQKSSIGNLVISANIILWKANPFFYLIMDQMITPMTLI